MERIAEYEDDSQDELDTEFNRDGDGIDNSISNEREEVHSPVRTANNNINFEADLTKLSYDEMKEMKFANLDIAEYFYKEYVRQMGFGIQINSSKKNVNGDTRMCLYVCQREGRRSDKWLQLPNRKRKAKLEFREDCQALMQVNFDNSSKRWVVKKLVIEHNHEMVNPKCVHFLSSHRRVNP